MLGQRIKFIFLYIVCITLGSISLANPSWTEKLCALALRTGEQVSKVTPKVLSSNSTPMERARQLHHLLKDKVSSQKVIIEKARKKLEEAEGIIKNFTPESSPLQKELIKALASYQWLPTHAIWSGWLTQLIHDIDNPYSRPFEIRANSEKNGEAPLGVFKSLFEALLLNVTPKDLANKLDGWIQSETQAVLIYTGLAQNSSKLATDVLKILLTTNLYFSDSIYFDPSNNGERPRLITLSFEKESLSETIRMFYRIAFFTEDEWFSLDDHEALELLEKYSLIPNKDLRNRIIVPTTLKPDFWGAFTNDGSAALQLKNRGSEVAHRDFEIDVQRLSQEIDRTAEIFGESHSFHVHVVTELPKNYSYSNQFLFWYKYLNDYLYLSGLQEGLHSNEMTQVPTLPSDASPIDALFGTIQNKIGLEARTLPSEITEIGDRNAKFNGVGLRSGSIYGTTDKNFLKIGLELRDITRDLQKLRDYTRQIGKALARRNWEAFDKSLLSQLPRVLPLSLEQVHDIANLDKITQINIMIKSEKMFLLPFTKFENALYLDFSDKSQLRASEDVRAQIERARQKYLEEIQSLENELVQVAKKGEPPDLEIIQHIIRIALTQWAKDSQVSRLYKGALVPL